MKRANNMKHTLTLLAALLLAMMNTSRGAAQAAEAPVNQRTVAVVSATAMDRWIDVTWSCETPPAGGFDVEISSDGTTFTKAEHAGADARSASVFVEKRPRSFLGLGGRLHLRVAELDAAGNPLARSPIVSVRPAKPRDIEKEVRQRFDYREDETTYRPTDPAYAVTYTEAQKQEQRDAARAMIAELQQAATNGTAPRTFVVPPRIYRVEPGQIRLKAVENLTVQVAGVEIIVDSEKSGAAFTFDQCTNIVLTGKGQPLIVDSEQLPMSVARIVAVDAKKLTLEVEVLPGYATDLPQSERMMAYDVRGRLLNVEQMGWKGIEKTGESRFRLTTASLRRAENRERILVPGSLLALHNNEGHQKRTHGVFSAHQCKDMTYEGIRVHNGGGAPADHGTAGHTVFRDWRLFPRPGTSRLPIATGLGQFSKNGGTFLFEDCAFGPHLDDGINLGSIIGMTLRQPGGDTIVLAGREPIPGETLTFYDFYSWQKLGEAKIVSSKSLKEPESVQAAEDWCKKNRITSHALRGIWQATLAAPVQLTPFAPVVYSNYRCDNITVRGCLFRDQLAQIMLLQGAKSGLIENNLLLRSTGPAVSMQFAQYWWEGPQPSNFFVRNNVIRDNPVSAPVSGEGGSGSICVWANTVRGGDSGRFPLSKSEPVTERLFSGFRIEGNTIVNPGAYGILLRNTKNAVIRHNRIINPGAAQTDSPVAGIGLDQVSDTLVADNEVVLGKGSAPEAVSLIRGVDAETVRIENNRTRAIRE
jgi:parallel beta-helix repeat protein